MGTQNTYFYDTFENVHYLGDNHAKKICKEMLGGPFFFSFPDWSIEGKHIAPFGGIFFTFWQRNEPLKLK
jgi:hypothetical protein